MRLQVLHQPTNKWTYEQNCSDRPTVEEIEPLQQFEMLWHCQHGADMLSGNDILLLSGVVVGKACYLQACFLTAPCMTTAGIRSWVIA